MEYASARATPELVGRREILGIVRKTIENKAKKTHVIYITARGGLGKTRLVEELLQERFRIRTALSIAKGFNKVKP